MRPRAGVLVSGGCDRLAAAVDGPRAAFPCHGWATNTGPIDPPGASATGKAVEWEGVDILEFRDGKVARLRIVYDRTDTLLELGFLRDADSGG